VDRNNNNNTKKPLEKSVVSLLLGVQSLHLII
jgi:hypothetical protein